ncbi:MAG: type II toxin-antitoxin system Phd/YefM family antitoxin [Candidatus Midichloria sp.]|nr:MAG: type II toxin-antitoxin system Phd/YefM family antitoxin [Candidatus Midichloria sp.]
MKEWQLKEAKKHLTKIIENVLQGEIQTIVKPSGESVYLVPGQKKDKCFEVKNIAPSHQPGLVI